MRRFAVFYFSVCVFALGCGTEPIGNVADLPVSDSGDDSSNVGGDGSFESAGSDASSAISSASGAPPNSFVHQALSLVLQRRLAGVNGTTNFPFDENIAAFIVLRSSAASVPERVSHRRGSQTLCWQLQKQ